MRGWVAAHGRPPAESCDQVELLPGVGPALRTLAAAGFALVVVTNQYLIGEGILTADEYARQTASLHAALAVEGVALLDVLHCPHPRWVACLCAKPGTGMVDEVARRHGPIDRQRSVVIGDASTDMQLAAAIGVRGYRIGVDVGGPPIAGTMTIPSITAVIDALARR